MASQSPSSQPVRSGSSADIEPPARGRGEQGGSEPSSGTGPSTLKVNLLMALMCTIWGSTWLVVRKGLDDLPPFSSAAVRFAIAWLAVAALAPILARREGGRRPGWRLAITMGGLNFGTSYAIVYWSETILPSGLVSVLWAVFPMMVAAGGHLVLPGEQLVRRQWWGFAVGFLGVVSLFATDIGALGPDAIPAALVLLCSPVVATIGTLAVKRAGPEISSVLLNRDAMFVGAVILTLLGLGFEREASFDWTPNAIGSVLYLSLLGTVLTFSLYFWLMRFAPAYKLSLVAYITPPTALGLGAWLADEPVSLYTGIGALGILIGVGLVMTGKASRKGPDDPSEPDQAGTPNGPTGAEELRSAARGV